MGHRILFHGGIEKFLSRAERSAPGNEIAFTPSNLPDPDIL